MVSVKHQDWFNAPDLQQVLALLNADGGETRIVGGAVRNSLMGMPIADVDLATDFLPDDVMARARAGGIKAVPTGIDHGTVTLVVNGRAFEVTTLRRDVSTDGRHAEVAFGKDWKVDAERRDLTMNALYATIDGDVVDFVGGIADIETRTVRFIGNAADRIAEDYLRILRYFRFFARYGAGRPDADALRAMARGRYGLLQLSAERVWSEIRKLLSADDPGRALLWMRTSGVLTLVLPETEKWGIDEIPGLIRAGEAFGWSPDPLLRLAAMVPPDAARLLAMVQRLKMSKEEASFFTDWANAPEVPKQISSLAFRRMLYRSGSAGLITRLKLALAIAHAKAQNDPAMLAEVARLRGLLDEATSWRKPVLPIGGADVIARSIPAGPEVGRILRVLEDEWVESGFSTDRDALLERLGQLT